MPRFTLQKTPREDKTPREGKTPRRDKTPRDKADKVEKDEGKPPGARYFCNENISRGVSPHSISFFTNRTTSFFDRASCPCTTCRRRSTTRGTADSCESNAELGPPPSGSWIFPRPLEISFRSHSTLRKSAQGSAHLTRVPDPRHNRVQQQCDVRRHVRRCALIIKRHNLVSQRALRQAEASTPQVSLRRLASSRPSRTTLRTSRIQNMASHSRPQLPRGENKTIHSHPLMYLTHRHNSCSSGTIPATDRVPKRTTSAGTCYRGARSGRVESSERYLRYSPKGDMSCLVLL